MSGVVMKEKKTLFGRIVRKIESELTPRENKWISPNVPLDDTQINDDTAAIQSRREELKVARHDKSDEVIVL